MKTKSYQYWQCDKCDEMNSSDVDKCKKCGSAIPVMYNEDTEFDNPFCEEIDESDTTGDLTPISTNEQSIYLKKEKTIVELRKAFFSTWIIVGKISIFCFIANVIILVIFLISLFSGALQL